MSKVNALDVANFFINEYKDTDEPLNRTDIEKFLYFAQAEALVRLGRPLFDEDFQAWKFGPFIPDIGAMFSHFSNGEPIREVIGRYDVHVFDPDELEVLFDVSKECGKYSTRELVRKTHVQDGPWDKVHSDDGAPKIIPKESIRDYYSEHSEIPHHISDSIGQIRKEGRTTSDGKNILQSDWM